MSILIPRRTVLRGLSAAVGLPLLEAMLPLNALAQSVNPKTTRMAFLFVPNGIDMNHWTPGYEGALNDLPEILQPLNGVKDSLTVVSGLTQHNAFALGDGPGDHARSSATWLTGVHVKKTAGSDIKNGISVDQVAAMQLGNRTKFGSLELGCERGAKAGDCDSGYSCAYSSSISWRGEATPNAKEVNPRLVFERLFGGGTAEDAQARARRDQYRTSILDLVTEDASRLKGLLGKRDQTKLDEYLNGVRDVEQRLQKAESSQVKAALAGATKPTGIPADYAEHIRLVGDMMVLAFQADLTRIATFMYANDGSNRSYPMIGVTDGHHEVSHHGMNPEKLEKKKKIDKFHVDQLAYILNRLQSVKELDGTLLDNSMIVYGAGISDGDRHNHDDLPILIAGKGSGTLKTGRHVNFPNNTPMNNLFLSMLDRMGCRMDQLGDSTGKLQGLF